MVKEKETVHAGVRHGRKKRRRQWNHPESADGRQHGDAHFSRPGNPSCRGRGCRSKKEKEIERTDSQESDTAS